MAEFTGLFKWSGQCLVFFKIILFFLFFFFNRYYQSPFSSLNMKADATNHLLALTLFPFKVMWQQHLFPHEIWYNLVVLNYRVVCFVFLLFL